MRLLKVVGLAAFAGVAATGAVIIRDQRRRHAYTPAEVRDRLQARLADAPETRQAPPDSGPLGISTTSYARSRAMNQAHARRSCRPAKSPDLRHWSM
jgi:hypothetical protein